MKRFFVIMAILIATAFFTIGEGKAVAESDQTIDISKLYVDMGLKGVVSYRAFEQAMTGYMKLNPKRKDVMTLIDFSKPSNVERLFIFDMKNMELVFSSLVSHGKNSGDQYATSFSNKSGSHKSSLGFFRTEFTYKGRNGYSLILEGLEKGINDNARERAIVVHGADYCDPSLVAKGARLGRSLGCPALPNEVNKEVIDAIKGGSLLFIYANNKEYISQSRILSGKSSSGLAAK